MNATPEHNPYQLLWDSLKTALETQLTDENIEGLKLAFLEANEGIPEKDQTSTEDVEKMVYLTAIALRETYMNMCAMEEKMLAIEKNNEQ